MRIWIGSGASGINSLIWLDIDTIVYSISKEIADYPGCDVATEIRKLSSLDTPN